MKPVMIFFGCLLFNMPGIGQLTHVPVENEYISAGAYSEHFKDAFSFTGNPACLGSIKRFSAGVLTERKWMLKELQTDELALSCNMGTGGLGIMLQRSGDGDYSEQAMELAVGKNLGRMELGIRFGYLLDQTAGYRSTGFGSTGIAMRFLVNEKLITGWELGLALFGKAGKTNPETGPQFFKFGFGYEWNATLYMALTIEKISGQPVNIIPSIEYRYGEHLFFSFGMNSSVTSPYFKTGWKKNQVSIQLYTVYEPVLGFSPGLLLLWESKIGK